MDCYCARHTGGAPLGPLTTPDRDESGQLACGPIPDGPGNASYTEIARDPGFHRLIFGLSADPIHVGHVEMVTQSTRALERRGYSVAEVLLVPVYRRNPVGVAKDRISDTYMYRLAMCVLAAREISERLDFSAERVQVSEVEAELARGRSAPNYTAETLAMLGAESPPNTGLVFLMSSELVSGPDPQFGRWYRPDEILRLAVLAICPRPGFAPNYSFIANLTEHGGHVVMLDEVSTPEVSASGIRALLQAGHSPAELGGQGMLTPSVAAYLGTHSLYATGSADLEL